MASAPSASSTSLAPVVLNDSLGRSLPATTLSDGRRVTKSRGSSLSRKSKKTCSRSRSASHVKREVVSVQEKQALVTTSGKLCLLCKTSESSPDPCFAGCTRLWGKPPYKKRCGEFTNQGDVCYYCQKPYMSMWYPKTKLSEMPDLLKHRDQRVKFFAMSALCVKTVLETQSTLRVCFPKDSVLHHDSEDKVIWEEPDDLYIPFWEYVKKKGDPRTNGEGHITGKNRRNQICVIVPESNILRRKRQHSESARISREIDDGQDLLEEGLLECKQAGVASTFMDMGLDSGQAGVGMALNLFGNGGNLQGLACNAGYEPTVEVVSEDLPALGAVPPILIKMEDEHIEKPVKARGRGRGVARDSKAKAVTRPGVAPVAAEVGFNLPGKSARNAANVGIMKGCKGRPKRDPLVMVRFELESFSLIPDNQSDPAFRKYFGDEHKTKHRYLVDLARKLDNEISECTCHEDLASLQIMRKRLQAVSDVACAFIRSAFTASEDFMKCYNEKLLYMKLEPVCSVEWPVTVSKAVYEYGLIQASPQKFWAALHSDALGAHHLEPSDAPRLVSERILKSVEGGSSLSMVRDAIFNVLECMPTVADGRDGGLAPNVKEQVPFAIALLKPKQAELAFLEVAMTHAEDEENIIVNTFTMFSLGRALITDARRVFQMRGNISLSKNRLKDVAAKVTIVMQSESLAHEKIRTAASVLNCAQKLLGSTEALDASALGADELEPVVHAFSSVGEFALERWCGMFDDAILASSCDAILLDSSSSLVAAMIKLFEISAFRKHEELTDLVRSLEHACDLYSLIHAMVTTKEDDLKEFSDDQCFEYYSTLMANNNADQTFTLRVGEQRLASISRFVRDIMLPSCPFGMILRPRLNAIILPILQTINVAAKKKIPPGTSFVSDELAARLLEDSVPICEEAVLLKVKSQLIVLGKRSMVHRLNFLWDFHALATRLSKLILILSVGGVEINQAALNESVAEDVRVMRASLKSFTDLLAQNAVLTAVAKKGSSLDDACDVDGKAVVVQATDMLANLSTALTHQLTDLTTVSKSSMPSGPVVLYYAISL
jgi:hypothetical protein